MSSTYRVSAKGLILMEKRVLLVRKPNGYWDLPGGRLEEGEAPEDALTREILEETGIHCQADTLLHNFVRPKPGRLDIFVAVYLASTAAGFSEVKLSHEHDDIGLFSFVDAGNLKMEDGFRHSLQLAKIVYIQ